MKLFCFIVTYLLFNASSFSQQSDTLHTYYLTKRVKTIYSLELIKKIHEKGVSDFESFKKEILQKLNAGIDVKARLEKDPSYLEKQEKIFSNPTEINRLSSFFDIYIEIDGVPVSTYDTSGIRKWYNTALLDTSFKKTNVSVVYQLDQLLDIPTQPEDSYDFSLDFSTLSDGRYVMFYDPFYNNQNNTFIKNVPYCFFSIKDHLIEGKAIFLYPNGDTLSSGSYVKGKKNGVWHLSLRINDSNEINHSFMVKNDLLVSTSRNREYRIDFKDDFLDGKFLYYEDDGLVTLGQFEKSKPVGKWEIYHHNGNLANRFYLTKSPFVNEMTPTYPLIYASMKQDRLRSYILTLPNGSTDILIPGLFSIFYNDTTVFDGEQIFHVYNPAFNGQDKFYTLYLTGAYESYYENGKMFFEVKIDENGIPIYFTDKIYDTEGKLIQEWKLNKSRSKGKMTYFLPDGNKQVYKIRQGVYRQVR